MAMLLRQPRFDVTFGFHDRLEPHLLAVLDGCKIRSLTLQKNNKHSKLCQIQICCDENGIDKRLSNLSNFSSRHTVGIAGDYIMYNILVAFYIACIAQNCGGRVNWILDGWRGFIRILQSLFLTPWSCKRARASAAVVVVSAYSSLSGRNENTFMGIGSSSTICTN